MAGSHAAICGIGLCPVTLREMEHAERAMAMFAWLVYNATDDLIFPYLARAPPYIEASLGGGRLRGWPGCAKVIEKWGFCGWRRVLSGLGCLLRTTPFCTLQ